MCYANADIMLMSDFPQAICRIEKQSFLLVGQRWDIDLKENWDFSKSDWEVRLRAYVTEFGTLRGPSALDYFVFPRRTYRDIPPFAIGRMAWDGWVVHRARSLGVPVIDATNAVMVVHQNHGYPHIAVGRSGKVAGPEVVLNRKLASRREYVIGLRHATHVLTSNGLKPAFTKKHLRLRLRAVPYYLPYPLGRLMRVLMEFVDERLLRLGKG
jgi:hypothetical protein